MAYTSVTYTFSNSTTADATQVNQNFTDLVNGLSDGTKDISINALTAAGTATLNGNVNLGNSSSDDLTITAALAGSVSVKTNATYNVGSSTLGLLSIYLGGASSYTVRLLASASQTATYTLTLPTTAGTKGYVPYNSDGSGTLTWTPGHTGINSVASADYTILNTDGYYIINVTTGSSARTITLPAAANNTGRKICIKKADSGTGSVIISGTVDGSTSNRIYNQYGFCEIISDGSAWYFSTLITESGTYTPTATYTNCASSVVDVHQYSRIGNICTIYGGATVTVTTTGADTYINPSLPCIYTSFTAAAEAHGTGILYKTSNNIKDACYVVAVANSQNLSVRCEGTSGGSNSAVAFYYTAQYQVL